MTPYEESWLSPPGPVARVHLRSRETNQEIGAVPMLIDSGADVTLIPRKAVEELQLAILEESSTSLRRR